MSYRSRVYRTIRLKNGDRIVSSMKTSDWAIWGICKFFFKAMFFLCFFWIIIPVKLLSKKNKYF